MSEPYYITTAIAYPNGKPHIGHAYEAIATDAIARFQRLMGRDVRFITGTDEHGLKMVQTARAAERETLEFADEMSSYFKQMCDTLNISYTNFIRTSDPAHHAASQALWRAMEASDDLYMDRYEGYYSVRDEAFYDEKELITGEGDEKLSPQGTPVEWTVEETWFFRLSKYQDKLLALYTEHPGFIQPESRRNEVMRFVEGGLRDLSVSRTSFDWGVKVPGSPDHVMYVWVDALTTYLSGLGYPDKTSDFGKFWPANVHIIGKDIVRFHAVYWPAFLMSANLPLPKQVFGHGFLLSRGEKMSKSLGNVVDPVELAELFGVDALRYFLLREVSFGQDGSYNAEAIVTRVNADLANSFGNLVQRVMGFIYKNLDGQLPVGKFPDMDAALGGKDPDHDFFSLLMNLEDVAIEFDLLHLDRGVENWIRAVYAANAYVDEQAPWALRKTDPERMNTVLACLVVAIANLAKAIAPVIPSGALAVLDLIGVPLNNRTFGDWMNINWYQNLNDVNYCISEPKPIFPRLELPLDALS
jgi:methionyl-tRNA synthetase